MSGSLVLLAIIAIVGMVVIGMYNRLVGLRNRFKNAFAQIDVQLKRRYDLIPNLVETAKSYLTHERETLEAVVAARNQASQASQGAAKSPGDLGAMQSLASAETVLGGAMGRLMAIVESYPDLKANESMGRLMEELSSTENKIAFARQAFNDAVMTYNTARETFPSVLIASTFGFQEASLFEITDEAEKAVPKVSF